MFWLTFFALTGAVAFAAGSARVISRQHRRAYGAGLVILGAFLLALTLPELLPALAAALACPKG